MRRYLSQGTEKERSVGESTVPSIPKIRKERNNLYVFYVYFYIYSFILFVILSGEFLWDETQTMQPCCIVVVNVL